MSDLGVSHLTIGQADIAATLIRRGVAVHAFNQRDVAGIDHVGIGSDFDGGALVPDGLQDVLEFPLTEIFENRDYKGSTHLFFDIGNDDRIAFFYYFGVVRKMWFDEPAEGTDRSAIRVRSSSIPSPVSAETWSAPGNRLRNRRRPSGSTRSILFRTTICASSRS